MSEYNYDKAVRNIGKEATMIWMYEVCREADKLFIRVKDIERTHGRLEKDMADLAAKVEQYDDHAGELVEGMKGMVYSLEEKVNLTQEDNNAISADVRDMKKCMPTAEEIVGGRPEVAKQPPEPEETPEDNQILLVEIDGTQYRGGKVSVKVIKPPDGNPQQCYDTAKPRTIDRYGDIIHQRFVNGQWEDM